MSMNNYDTNGNRTRDLPACSAAQLLYAIRILVQKLFTPQNVILSAGWWCFSTVSATLYCHTDKEIKYFAYSIYLMLF